MTLGAMLFAPAVADATRWYYNRQAIPQGVVREAPSQTNKPMIVTVRRHRARPIKLSCQMNGVTALWNGPEFGYSEVRAVSFACPGATITPTGTWTSVLTGTEVPLLDTFSGVQLHVMVGATDYGAFAGTLAPHVGDSDPEGAKDNQEGLGDDLDTLLYFSGDKLPGPNGATLSLHGWYGIGPKHEGATGEVR